MHTEVQRGCPIPRISASRPATSTALCSLLWQNPVTCNSQQQQQLNHSKRNEFKEAACKHTRVCWGCLSHKWNGPSHIKSFEGELLIRSRHSRLMEQHPLAEPTHSEGQKRTWPILVVHFYWRHGQRIMALTEGLWSCWLGKHHSLPGIGGGVQHLSERAKLGLVFSAEGSANISSNV